MHPTRSRTNSAALQIGTSWGNSGPLRQEPQQLPPPLVGERTLTLPPAMPAEGEASSKPMAPEQPTHSTTFTSRMKRPSPSSIREGLHRGVADLWDEVVGEAVRPVGVVAPQEEGEARGGRHPRGDILRLQGEALGDRSLDVGVRADGETGTRCVYSMHNCVSPVLMRSVRSPLVSVNHRSRSLLIGLCWRKSSSLVFPSCDLMSRLPKLCKPTLIRLFSSF